MSGPSVTAESSRAFGRSDPAARVRQGILLLALVLSPLSYTVKVVYDLPFRWVDPTLALGAVAALLPPWSLRDAHHRLRQVSVLGIVFLAAYWLAAAGAIVDSRFAGDDPFREPLRLTLASLLGVACVRVFSTPRALRRAATLLGYVAVGEVLVAVYLLAALAFPLPLPEAWRVYQEAYWLRQTVYAGQLVLPRLGGTFVEAPPFGLYVLGSLVVVHAGRRASRIAGAPTPPRWIDAALWVGVVGSLSTQVLAGAATWGIGIVAPRMVGRSARRRAWLAVIALGLLASLSALAYYKYVESEREITQKGASVGERRAHTELATTLFLQHPLLGIGPGEFGESALRASHGLYEETTNVQLTAAEVLAETGVVGAACLLLALGGLMRLFLAHRDYWSIAATSGLLVADAFQANWRWPIVFVGIASVLAMSFMQHRVQRRER